MSQAAFHSISPRSSKKTGQKVRPVKILSLHKAKNPINSVLIYARVLSTTRPDRLVHNVVKVGRAFRCSCEGNILGGNRCVHIRAVARRLKAVA
jgi:hypothetical protein